MKRGIWIFLTMVGIVTFVAIIFFSIRGYLKVPASFASNSSKHQLTGPSQQSETSYFGYTAHRFTNALGLSLHYYLYIPANYNPQEKYPLVVLLEGGGERSRPNYTAAQNQKLILNDAYVQVWSADYNAPGNPHIQQRWPCFVVVPQMSISQQWVNTSVHKGSYTQPAQPSTPLLLTKELL